ncbi:hypothetical protein Salat_2674000 [Sesamum alatum]|uniref:Uncharacterized protein n=1 Tax=Sesamum alatum TaxID=300844 RepID=A0AAE1XQH4_9LAMI|nr:hypothetical protein Salat_2674000 [Sesamum alatum]
MSVGRGSSFNRLSFYRVARLIHSYLCRESNEVRTDDAKMMKEGTRNRGKMEGSPPVNQIPREPVLKRYKFLWRVFLIFNFALGAYMFAQPGRKEKVKEKSEVPAEVAPPPATVTAPPVEEEPVISPPITKPVIVRPPLPEDQQREIFKWMLEEKRKVKPKSRDDKQRNDEEKAILKEFIRSQSLPSI